VDRYTPAVTPVYESDRKAAAADEEEEVDVRPRTWISVVGILWIASAAFSAKEVRDAHGSVVGMVLVAIGALMPMFLVRLRGTADGVPRAVWIGCAAAWVAGSVETARTVHWWFLAETPMAMRVAVGADAAVGALFLASGAYMLSRSIGSLAAERRAFLQGSLVLVGLRVAALVAARAVLTVESLWVLPVLLLVQGAAVLWVCLRLIAARPHIRRIAGIFE
jgi:hypothetical protein